MIIQLTDIVVSNVFNLNKKKIFFFSLFFSSSCVQGEVHVRSVHRHVLVFRERCMSEVFIDMFVCSWRGACTKCSETCSCVQGEVHVRSVQKRVRELRER